MYYNYEYKVNKIDPIQFADEEYRDITDLAVPNVAPYYMISNYGHVYNKRRNHLMSPSSNRRGYQIVGLSLNGGGCLTRTVHRLVMLTFCYIANHDVLEVNHKNGDKKCNCLYNLEWVTPLENMHHAYETGLNPNYGENSRLAKLSNEQVHYICQCFSEGIPFDEISRRMGPLPVKNIYGTLNNILARHSWNSIGSQYVFQEYHSGLDRFTIEEVVQVCNYLQMKYNYKEILTAMGYDIYSMTPECLDSYNKIISGIRTKTRYTEISETYNFPTGNAQTFTNDQVREICSYLEKQMTFDQILEALGYDLENMDRSEMLNIKSVLSAIKNRARFKKISEPYVF